LSAPFFNKAHIIKEHCKVLSNDANYKAFDANYKAFCEPLLQSGCYVMCNTATFIPLTFCMHPPLIVWTAMA
jgi:hypothetical protein